MTGLESFGMFGELELVLVVVLMFVCLNVECLIVWIFECFMFDCLGV